MKIYWELNKTPTTIEESWDYVWTLIWMVIIVEIVKHLIKYLLGS